MYLLLKPRKEKENYVKGEIMDIFGVLSFVGGLAMFLYGMSAICLLYTSDAADE